MLTEDFEQAQYLSSQVEQARQRAVLAASDAGSSRDGAHAAEQVAREHAKDAERVVQGAEKARDAAQAAADRAEAPTDAMVATLAGSHVSLTRAAIDQAAGDMINTGGSTTQAAGDARWVTQAAADIIVANEIERTGSETQVSGDARWLQLNNSDSTVAGLMSGPTQTHNALSGVVTAATERAFTVTKISATSSIPEHTITRYFGGAKSGVSVKRLVGGGAPTATPVRETLSSFHRRSGAAIVANATGWWADGLVMGLSIQDGVLLKGWDTGTSDLGKEALVIMRDGSMKIYNSSTPAQQVVDDGGWYSFGWGHAFYKNGEITNFRSIWRYSESSGQITGRQMLGDTLDGDIVLVTFPGVTNSWGATAQNVLDAVAGMNIRTLYNLDCGGSTQTLVDGDYAVSSSDGAERPVPDALAIYSINTTPRKKAVEWVDIPLTAAYERQATFTPQMAIRDGVAYFRGAVKRADGANFTAGATQYLTASIAALTGIEPMDGTRTTWGQTNSGPIRIWVQGTTIQVYIPTGAAVSYIGLSALSGLLLGK